MEALDYYGISDLQIVHKPLPNVLLSRRSNTTYQFNCYLWLPSACLSGYFKKKRTLRRQWLYEK